MCRGAPIAPSNTPHAGMGSASLTPLDAHLPFLPIATVPLTPELIADIEESSGVEEAETSGVEKSEEAPLSIAEAKRRLAKTLGVDPATIKITVEA
jgi:hypothetical protein